MTVEADRALVIVDLQRVVGPGGAWELPGLERILPPVRRLLEGFGAASVLTRHRLAPDGPGAWSGFASRWAHLDAEPSVWALLDEVAAAVPSGAAVVDKTTYAAFPLPELTARLGQGPAAELVVAGCETDCCIAATLFAAVDAGVAVTLVEDAIAGPDAVGHDGVLAAARRLPEQVRVVSADEAVRQPFPSPPVSGEAGSGHGRSS